MSSSSSLNNLTIRDVVIRGFIPHRSLHEDIEETSSMCQFCKNTSSASSVYRISCYFDKGETKRELAMCASCIHDYHMYLEDMQQKQSAEPRLVVADKYDRAKSEIYSACKDIVKKNTESNNENKNSDIDNNNNKYGLDYFINTIKSLYETSNTVKYYLGDPDSISLDNKKLWPIRYDIFVNDTSLKAKQ